MEDREGEEEGGTGALVRSPCACSVPGTLPCFNTSLNPQSSLGVGTSISPILQVRKRRHTIVRELAQSTWPINGGAGIRIQTDRPQTFCAPSLGSLPPCLGDGSLLWNIPKVLLRLAREGDSFSFRGWGGGDRILKGLLLQLIV